MNFNSSIFRYHADGVLYKNNCALPQLCHLNYTEIGEGQKWGFFRLVVDLDREAHFTHSRKDLSCIV